MRPRVDDSCCVRPKLAKVRQWNNKALTYPMDWKEYVGSFLEAYDKLDASSNQKKREFLKEYFVFGEDKDARLTELSMDPYDGKGRYILNDWMQCCQHRALTCPANDESEEATDRFIAWLQGEGQTGDKLQVCMHRTHELGENLKGPRKRQRVEGGRRRKSRRRKSRHRRSSKRNRLTRS